MAFKDETVTSLTTVRDDGSKAVDIGTFTPKDGAGNDFPASLVLWDQAGDQYLALAMQDDGIGHHPVGFLGIGAVGTDWTPTLKIYNTGGLSLMGTDGLDFATGTTRVLPTEIRTQTLAANSALEPLTIDGAGAPVVFTSAPDLHPDVTNVTPGVAGLSVRAAPYDFTVSRLGNGHAVIQGQLSNTSGAAIASGGTIVAAGQLPAWARPPAGLIQQVFATGAPTAGQSTFAEILSTGQIRLWGGTFPTGTFLVVSGVYRCAGA